MVTDDNCVSVCYRWRIGCFMRDIMQLEPGAGRDSPVFTLQKASGLKFSLNIVPRIGRHRGFSSIWLVARDLGGLKSFHFRHIGFWLENSGGKRFGEFDTSHTFDETRSCIGFEKYMTRASLNAFNDTLSWGEAFICCRLVYDVPSELGSVVSSTPITVPDLLSSVSSGSCPTIDKGDEFRKQLWQLHQKGVYDCVLKVGDMQFKASKFMLMAQSDVFYELFKHSSGKITILTLKNAVSSNTMEKFIEWIYLGTVKGVPGTNLEEFYKLAAEYQILALKDNCVTWMIGTLTVHNVEARNVLAQLYMEARLLRSTEAFIRRRFSHI